VVRRPGGGVGLQVQVERQVDHHVGAAQLLRDGRVPHVEDVPFGVGALAPPLVDGDDLLDLLRGGQPLGEQRADPGRGTGDRAAGPARGTGGRVSRCANLRIWGTHQASPAVFFSTGASDAYVPGGSSLPQAVCRRSTEARSASGVYAGWCCRAAVPPERTGGPTSRGIPCVTPHSDSAFRRRSRTTATRARRRTRRAAVVRARPTRSASARPEQAALAAPGRTIRSPRCSVP